MLLVVAGVFRVVILVKNTRFPATFSAAKLRKNLRISKKKRNFVPENGLISNKL